MSEETEKKEEIKQEPEEQVNTDLEKALRYGYDPKGKLDATTWLNNYTWDREVKRLNSKLEQQSRTLESLAEHNSKVEQVAYRKAMEEMDRKLEEAVQLGDSKAVKAINKEISEISPPSQPVTASQLSSEAVSARDDFIRRNSEWFNNNNPDNASMHAFAVAKATQIGIEHPHMSPQDQLREVEDAIHKKFKSHFSKDRDSDDEQEERAEKSRNPSVEAAVAKTVKNKKASIDDLSSQERSLAETLRRTVKKFDMDAYIRQCKELNS